MHRCSLASWTLYSRDARTLAVMAHPLLYLLLLLLLGRTVRPFVALGLHRPLRYVGSIFLYNLLAIMVTKQLDSVWHSILDLFRPGTVWGFDLVKEIDILI